MIYRILFPSLWLAFIAFWIVMARGGKTVAEREDLYSRLSHCGPLAIAVLSAGRARRPRAAPQRPLRARTLWGSCNLLPR